jgi:Xaa-Pro aminopeptidase
MTVTQTADGLAISKDEHEARVERVREGLRERGHTVGLAYGTQHMPGDVQYLTGYDPHIENVALLVLPDDVIVMGGAEGAEMFADGGRLGTWHNLAAFEIPFQDYGDTKFWDLREILRDRLGSVPDKVGLLSQANVLSAEIVGLAREAVGDGDLEDVSSILAELRYRKSPAELELHRVASRVATEAMRAMLAVVEPGVRELEVAAEGDRVVKRMGAYAHGFDAIVCSAARINTIIGRATNRVIERGDMVMLGIAPRYEGYTSALGRAVVAGGASAAQAGFLEEGIRAHELSVDALRAEDPAREVDLAARRPLESVGLGGYHTYGVGHGIGLSECLERETATRVSDYTIPSGITMMLDVGIFGHPQHFGARHEDPFLVTHDGVTEKLTDLPMRVFE